MQLSCVYIWLPVAERCWDTCSAADLAKLCAVSKADADFFQPSARDQRITELAAGLVHAVAEVRRDAADALDRFGGNVVASVVPQLAMALADDDKYVCFKATQVLGKLGRASAPAVPGLLKLLQDDDDDIRLWAMETLERIGDSARACAPALVELLEHGNPVVREGSLLTLSNIGQLRVAELIGSLSDDATQVRLKAVSLLGTLGESAQPAVPMLIQLCVDADADVRLRATELLAKLDQVGPMVSVMELIGLLEHKDKLVCFKAIETLSGMGQFAAPGVPNLIKLLGDDDADVRLWAAEALGQLNEVSHDAIPTLSDMLCDEDPDVQRGARDAIKRIKASALS